MARGKSFVKEVFDDVIDYESKNIAVYDYADVPTIRRFALDNTRIRSLVGPFGPLSCDTEYLTEQGWKPICDYSEGERIVQVSKQDGSASLVVPDHYIVQPCEEFIHFDSERLDMMLSPEHLVLVKDSYGKMVSRTAQSIYEQHQRTKNGSQDVIPITFQYHNNTSMLLSDMELRLAVATVADASFHKKSGNRDGTYNTNHCCMGFRKDRKKDRIRYLLSSLNIPYTESPSPSGTVYFYFPTVTRLKEFVGEFWLASYEQRKIICDEIRYWDGHENEDGSAEFYSTSKASVDFIQYCFASTGVGASIRAREPNGDCWGKKTRYSSRNYTSQTFVGMPQKKDGIHYEKFGNGFKYCFATESGYFVARRNGKIFVTHNSGKSSGCVMELIRRAHEQKPQEDGIRRTRWAVVRNFYGQLRDTTIKTFFDWVPPHRYGVYKSQEHDYIITGFDGCLIEVMFRALDRPDQVKNLLSLELTGAWINEYREIDKAIFMALDGRIDRYPAKKNGGCTWTGIFMDTNPPEEDSFWYNYFEKDKPDNAKIFKQPSGLSPMAENLKWLPKNYYVNLAKGKTDQFVNVYVHGKYGYTQEGKLVYPAFNDSLHVSSNIIYPIENRPLMLGFDFALNPTCVIAQITPRGQLYVLDEAYGEGMGIENFLTNILDPLLQSKYSGYQVMGAGDPTGTSRSPTDESTCFGVLWAHGYNNVNPAGTNSIIARIGAVESYLTRLVDGMPAFVLSPNCTKLRKGFNGGYRRKKIPGTEDYYDIPEKNHMSHVQDALSYLCLEIGETEKHMERQAKVRNMERMLRMSQRQFADSVAGY